jgi:carbon storage regulator
MLVLTRRIDGEIVIAGSIRVKVLTVQGDKVRLGVSAPDSVTVDRQEVHDRRAEFVVGRKARKRLSRRTRGGAAGTNENPHRPCQGGCRKPGD